MKTAFIVRSSVTNPNGTLTHFECTVPPGITGALDVAVSLMIGEFKLAREVLLPLMQEATVVSIDPKWLRVGRSNVIWVQGSGFNNGDRYICHFENPLFAN